MRRLKAGELEAFEVLYMKYRTPLYSYLCAHTASTMVAEELLQDTFAKLVQHKDSFRFESKFSTWLWTLARHTMVDHHRNREQRLALVSSADEGLLATLEAPLSSAEAQLVAEAQSRAVAECMEELAPQQKEAVLLRAQGELAYEEIARLLDTSVSAVKSLLVRAKDKLMDCLKRGGHHAE